MDEFIDRDDVLGGAWSALVMALNVAAAISLIVGLGFLLIFASKNLG